MDTVVSLNSITLRLRQKRPTRMEDTLMKLSLRNVSERLALVVHFDSTKIQILNLITV